MGIVASFQEISPRLLNRLIVEPQILGGVISLPDAFDIIEKFKIKSENIDEFSWAEVYIKNYINETSHSTDETDYYLEKFNVFKILEQEGFTPNDSSSCIDIDKCWPTFCAMLRSKLNPTDEDLEYIVKGGAIIRIHGDLIRYLSPEQTCRAHESLKKITFENIIERGCIGGVVDIAPFAYGGVIGLYENFRGEKILETRDRRFIKVKKSLLFQIEELEYLLNKVRDYYQTTASKEFGMLLSLS